MFPSINTILTFSGIIRPPFHQLFELSRPTLLKNLLKRERKYPLKVKEFIYWRKDISGKKLKRKNKIAIGQ